jgi:O-antigen ligase
VLTELGLVGLVAFLLWLAALWRHLAVPPIASADPSVLSIRYAGVICLVTVMGLGLFNEALYPSRALPGFMGFFLGFLAVVGHPGWFDPVAPPYDQLP